MTEQKPSVGQIVIYNHITSKDAHVPLTKSPAIICVVAANGELTLCVFATIGVLFRKSEEQGDGISQWNWPPKV